MYTYTEKGRERDNLVRQNRQERGSYVLFVFVFWKASIC